MRRLKSSMESIIFMTNYGGTEKLLLIYTVRVPSRPRRLPPYCHSSYSPTIPSSASLSKAVSTIAVVLRFAARFTGLLRLTVGYELLFLDAHSFPISHSMHPVWSKFAAIQFAMTQFPSAEWIWWLDMDALIMTPSIDLQERLLSPDGMVNRLLNKTRIVANERINIVEGEETPELVIDEVSMHRIYSLSPYSSCCLVFRVLITSLLISYIFSRKSSFTRFVRSCPLMLMIDTRPLHHLPPPNP